MFTSYDYDLIDNHIPIRLSDPFGGAEESTRFQCSYFTGKLNKDLYEHVQNVEDHDGLEVLQLIVEESDKPPDNAALKMNMVFNKLMLDKDGK